LERDSHELEVTPNFKFIVSFGESLERVCQELDIHSYHKLVPIWDGTSCDQNFLGKSSLQNEFKSFMSWSEAGSWQKICPQHFSNLEMLQETPENRDQSNKMLLSGKTYYTFVVKMVKI
jgi:hypothetical protein